MRKLIMITSIKIRPSTRTKLKILSAMHNMPIGEVIENLLVGADKVKFIKKEQNKKYVNKSNKRK